MHAQDIATVGKLSWYVFDIVHDALIIYTHPFLVRRSSGVSSTCLTNSKR